MKFIGREEQLKKLDRVINTDELTFSLIYGRRRVGKSELVKQAIKRNDVKRYDIVVVNEGDKSIIKRVIGLPGETIEYKDNKLYINGKETSDPYPSTETDDFSITDIGHTKIPGDCYFVMGDNRANSLDSRYPTVGVVRKNQIVGRAKLRIWPLNKLGIVK